MCACACVRGGPARGIRRIGAAKVYYLGVIHQKKLLSAGSDCTVKIWDLDSAQTQQINFKNPIYACEILNQEEFAVGDGANVCIYNIYNLSQGKLIVQHKGFVTQIQKINATTVVSGDSKGYLKLWGLGASA